MKTRLLIVLLGHLCLTSNAQQATGKAQQIIERMQQVYQTARTYQDAGEVISEFTYENPKWYQKTGFTNKLHFTSAFNRSTNQFRYMYESQNRSLFYSDTYLIGSANGKTRTYWALNKRLENESTLHDALAAAAGVSQTSSRKITSYLFNDLNETGLILQRVMGLTLTGYQKIDGADCFMLKGLNDSSPKIPTTIWIDKKSFLIRKIEEIRHIPGTSVKVTLYFHPTLNKPIAEKDLAFDYELYQPLF